MGLGSDCYRPTCFHNTDIEVDMTIRIEVTGYKPEITCRNNFSLAMEGYELKSLTGESSVIFGAMESPFTDVVDYAASNGMLDELIQKAIEKKGKEVA